MKKWHSTAALKWLECIIEERFGVHFDLCLNEYVNIITIKLPGDPNLITLDIEGKCFVRADSDLPFITWAIERNHGWSPAVDENMPAPGYSILPTPLIRQIDQGMHIGYDILGMTYWMLTRQEEVGRNDLDEHGRFPATSSHAYKHGYLDRPVVDEWLHILGQVINRTWPQIKLKRPIFEIKLSHDVDRPFQYLFLPGRRLVRQLFSDILKRHDICLAAERFRKWNLVRSGRFELDPFNTFDWLMDLSERHGLKSAFYFLAGGQHLLDGDYKLEHTVIRSLLRNIHSRGHEIGLHPSYNTFQDVQALVHEARHLREVCDEEGIWQEQWGGRMHYLRWRLPLTLQAWEAANMAYDSTINYGEYPGFRAGTCFEYPAYDVEDDKMLKVRLRPLIVMNQSQYKTDSNDYLEDQNTFKHLKVLIERCKKVCGQFTMLWHNSDLDESNRSIYIRLLSEAVG